MTQIQITKTATFQHVAKPRPKPKYKPAPIIKPVGSIRTVMVAGRPYSFFAVVIGGRH